MNLTFDFNNPTRILFGCGTLDLLGKQDLPGKKALVLLSNGKIRQGQRRAGPHAGSAGAGRCGNGSI